MLRRVPNDFPLFGALAAGGAFLAFGFTGMLVENNIGRPSSTAALGCLFLPMWAVLFAVGGLILGSGLRLFWKQLKPDGPEKRPTRKLQISLAVILLLSSLSGAATANIRERSQRPQVITDAGVIARSVASNSDDALGTAAKLFGGKGVRDAISWGTNESTVTVNGLKLSVTDRKASSSVVLDAAGLDYIRSVYAAPLLTSKNESVLVIVADGRATGRRALVSVISSDYRILFQERAERFWPADNQPLEIRVDRNRGSQIAVIGPSCKQSLILAPR